MFLCFMIIYAYVKILIVYIYDCKKNIFNKIRYKEIKEISYIGNGYFKSNLQDSDIIYIIDKSGQIVKKILSLKI